MQALIPTPCSPACLLAVLSGEDKHGNGGQRIRIRRLALWQVAEVALHKHLPALCRVHYRREALLLRALMFCHGRYLTLLCGWYGQV